MEVDRQTDAAKLAQLESGIARVLADVRAAVEDWRAMRDRMVEVLGRIETARAGVSHAEIEEGRAFLAWLLQDHFTFLGCRDYALESGRTGDELRIVPGSGRGILRERGETLSMSFASLPPEARKRARVKELLVLTKANSRSTVHRPGHLDYVGVKHFNATGEVVGETRFLGLYTHTVYAESPMQVPLLRRNLGCVFQDFKLLPNRTAAENIGYALRVQGESSTQIRKKVPEVLNLVGLSHKMNSRPEELSGGEQQRVSIARAFVNHPPLLVCDEPTGNLDPDTSVGIMQLLYRINRTGTTILMVTHDREMVDKMRKRVIALEAGKLVRDERRGGYTEE